MNCKFYFDFLIRITRVKLTNLFIVRFPLRMLSLTVRKVSRWCNLYLLFPDKNYLYLWRIFVIACAHRYVDLFQHILSYSFCFHVRECRCFTGAYFTSVDGETNYSNEIEVGNWKWSLCAAYSHEQVIKMS